MNRLPTRLVLSVLVVCVLACEAQPVTVTLDPPNLELNGKDDTQTIKAIVKIPTGAQIVASTTWESADPTIATVDNGKVTAVKSGETTVSATSGKSTATAKVSVTVATSVEVNPKTLALSGPEDTKTVSAIVKDDAGRTLPKAVVFWRSSNDKVITVEEGKVTAVGPGKAKLTATHAGLSGAVDVTVAGTFDKVVLTPAAVVLKKAGQTAKVTASARDGKKQVEGIEFTWTSSNEKVAKVSPAGEITAVKKGSAKVTATAGKKSATANVTVK